MVHLKGKIIQNRFLGNFTNPSGLSAYQVALKNGFTGSEEEWLLSLKGEPGLNGTNGTNGRDGYTPIKGIDYVDGKDGVSPTITSSKEDKTTILSITDVNGLHSVEINDGNDGIDGYTPIKGIDYVDGEDGVSPTITCNKIGTTTFIYITDKNGNQEIQIEDGKDGKDGTTGTSDYNMLSNKPAINGVILEGNMSSEDLNISSKTTYSLEEQVVGTWTNGKPIYRKVVEINSPNFTAGAWNSISCVPSNYVDELTDITITYEMDGNNLGKLPKYDPTTVWNCFINELRRDTGIIELYPYSSFNEHLSKMKVTLEYTKTNDTATIG